MYIMENLLLVAYLITSAMSKMPQFAFKKLIDQKSQR